MWRRYFRPGVLVGHLLVVAAALTCLRLGWWQWNVSQETRGTVQNLGYALLWPVFAGSFLYMWLRFLHLESVREAADKTPGERGGPADAAGDGDDAATRSTGAAVRTADDLGAGGDGDESTDPGATDTPEDSRPQRDAGGGYTIAVATVVGDDDEDDELTAYNRALAALAEQDERRAR